MSVTIRKTDIASGKISLVLSQNEYPGVKRIAGFVAEDMEKVFGVKPQIRLLQEIATDAAKKAPDQAEKKAILVLSLDRAAEDGSMEADGICQKMGISADEIRGKRECYLIKSVTVDEKEILLILGSDKRGCIYGLFALSEKLGVSPFVNWLDILPAKKEEFVFEDSMAAVSKEPSVRYRGFFINDEWPAFGTWVSRRFGGFNAKAYEGIFELLLRLKGNYLWPAMWSARDL